MAYPCLVNIISNFLYIPYEAYSIEKIAIPASNNIFDERLKHKQKIKFDLLKSYQNDIRSLMQFLKETQEDLKKPFMKHGIMRRIGSSDLHCTEDDLQVFYRDNIQSYDQTTITGTDISQIDEAAIKRYRTLRSEVNPAAEELTYDDAELLEALGCLSDNKKELNLAGVLLFGNSKVLRSKLPMMRVDYIRVPGNQWVENPDDRFITTDMRGPLILLVYRLINAINDDLPKGFLLPDNSLQAKSVGLPIKALREAIVNALIHRSYRVHRPTQVIRYDNRIEIINPGYSLKAEDQLGKPGSETRNPFIASVFHVRYR